MTTLRPIRHEDRLSVVDHLDELRKRIFVCLGVLIIAFLFCFWQNGALIGVLNRALPDAAKTGLGSQQSTNADLGKAFRSLSGDMRQIQAGLSQSTSVSSQAVTAAGAAAKTMARIGNALPKEADAQAKPLTIGVSESFTTTLSVAGYFALLISLPVILYEAYAYVIPALERRERGVALPAMIFSPLLFIAGTVFCYFAIVPPAIHFLLGYNSQHFQILVQAKSYYKFEIILMLAIGLVFEVPLMLLGLQRAGLITAKTLTLNWRYALVLISVGAAALPGVDPVSMAFETLPLVGVYLLSIALLKIADHRDAVRAAAEAAAVAAAEAAAAEDETGTEDDEES